MIRTAIIGLVACSLACASTPPAASPSGEHHEHDGHGGHKGDHPKLSGALAGFHDVLAPLWHSPKGPDRESKTCDAIPKLEESAGNVQKETPGPDAAGLVASVGELKTECAKASGSRADFDAKLSGVHDAFHKIVEKTH